MDNHNGLIITMDIIIKMDLIIIMEITIMNIRLTSQWTSVARTLASPLRTPHILSPWSAVKDPLFAASLENIYKLLGL